MEAVGRSDSYYAQASSFGGSPHYLNINCSSLGPEFHHNSSPLPPLLGLLRSPHFSLDYRSDWQK